MNTRQRVFLRQCFSNARRSPMILVSKSFWKLARLPGYKCCKKNVAVDSSYFLIQFQSTAHCFLHISKVYVLSSIVCIWDTWLLLPHATKRRPPLAVDPQTSFHWIGGERTKSGLLLVRHLSSDRSAPKCSTMRKLLSLTCSPPHLLLVHLQIFFLKMQVVANCKALMR